MKTFELGRKLFLSSWIACFATASAVALDDPTFNGLARTVHCQANTVTFCSKDGYCVDGSRALGGHWANYWIYLGKQKISDQSPPGPKAASISIQELSRVEFNKVLFIKFTYGADNSTPTKAMLMFVPNNAGGYQIMFASNSRLNMSPPDPLNETGFVTAINAGTCSIENSYGD